jgi:MFS transporter, AAHS family, 3-hydroxyphenylpropionic acid transporter
MPGGLRLAITVVLCFVAALFEGLDIQSMGVAAPHLAPALHLGPGTMGWILSASTMGLMIGASIGGRLSDRIGRAWVLIGSMLTLGVFSLGTALIHSAPGLVVARIFAGLGLGGAFPNLIALISEIAPKRRRAMILGMIYCGLPVGGAVAGALMVSAPPGEWRRVFWVGGAGPLVLAPLLLLLPRGRPSASAESQSAGNGQEAVERLFGPRAATTLLLWLAYFFTLFAIYIQLNWMPSFLRAKGFSLRDASQSAVYLNLGAAFGSLVLGYVLDRLKSARVLPVVYLGMAAALISLVLAQGSGLLAAAFVAGLFVIGGQLALYALAPLCYAPEIRGAGVGAAVAAGRGGAIMGPILAGLVLAHGYGANAVPLLALPGLVIALAAVMWVANHGPLPQEAT